jgi:hypothetical protein
VFPVNGIFVAPFGGFGLDGAPIGQGGPYCVSSANGANCSNPQSVTSVVLPVAISKVHNCPELVALLNALK